MNPLEPFKNPKLQTGFDPTLPGDNLFSRITVSCRDSGASASKSSLNVLFRASLFLSIFSLKVVFKSDKALGIANFLFEVSSCLICSEFKTLEYNCK